MRRSVCATCSSPIAAMGARRSSSRAPFASCSGWSGCTCPAFRFGTSGADTSIRASSFARARAGRAIERAVELRFGGRCVPARLSIAPLPSEVAAKALAQARKRASKKGEKVDPQSELMAGFVTLLTTIDAETASIASVMSWYRVRWQIELYFKRCKSLLQHPVLSADDDLQRVRLLVAMLVAVIVDQMNEPAARATKAGALSLWRLTQIHLLDVQSAVAGGRPRQQKRRRSRVVARNERATEKTASRSLQLDDMQDAQRTAICLA